LIKKSIETWKKKKEVGEFLGKIKVECPLCKVYSNYGMQDESKYCSQCPIKILTLAKHCRKTPYYDNYRETWDNYCNNMLLFLKAVLEIYQNRLKQD